jgi:hypothetical protein
MGVTDAVGAAVSVATVVAVSVGTIDAAEGDSVGVAVGVSATATGLPRSSRAAGVPGVDVGVVDSVGDGVSLTVAVDLGVSVTGIWTVGCVTDRVGITGGGATRTVEAVMVGGAATGFVGVDEATFDAVAVGETTRVAEAVVTGEAPGDPRDVAVVDFDGTAAGDAPVRAVAAGERVAASGLPLAARVGLAPAVGVPCPDCSFAGGVVPPAVDGVSGANGVKRPAVASASTVASLAALSA